MNILFTICARAGSKGVKGKNTRLLCGRPLAYYTIAAFEEYKIKYPDTQKISLAVNTDSELLNEQINHTGIEYLSVERKDSLAGDIVAKKDVIKDTLKEAEQLSNVEVYEKDVFINITGASVARSCVVPDAALPARVNQHVSIIRCKQSVFNPIFANQQFLNSSFKKMLLVLGEAGGATRQAITKQQLEDLSVIVPPLELQEEFSVFVAYVARQKLKIQQGLDKLKVLKKALMQQYFG